MLLWKDLYIRQGAAADVVLLNANPLENISNIQTIEGVLVGNNG